MFAELISVLLYFNDWKNMCYLCVNTLVHILQQLLTYIRKLYLTNANYLMKKLIILLGLMISLYSKADESFKIIFDRSNFSDSTNISFLPNEFSHDMLFKLPVIDKQRSTPIENYFITNIQDKIYALHSGSFNVMLWNGSDWINLYKASYHGYNFEAFFFVYEDNLYSLGTYGYWLTHSNVLKFNFDAEVWDMVITRNSPENYGSYFVGQIGDTLISIFGFNLNESTGDRSKIIDGHLLDLKNKTWSEVGLAENIVPVENFFLEYKTRVDLKDYTVMENRLDTQKGLFVIDKINLEINFFANEDGYFFHSSVLDYIVDNKITYEEYGIVKTLNIDSLFMKEHITSSIALYSPENKVTSNLLIALYITLALIIIIIALLVIRRKRSSNGEIESDNLISLYSETLEKIMLIINEQGEATLDTSELNELLEINHMTYDAQRAKRAKLINELNYSHNLIHNCNLIERRRNPKDKRQIAYHMNISKG